MSTRGGGRGGGRGRRGGGDFPHRGGGRAGGDGGRGGGGRERGGGGGRGGGGSERGGGGGGDQHFVPPSRREPTPIAYSQPAPPVSPRDLASSSSTVPSPKALSKEVEKMTIGGDKKEEPLAVTGKPTDELAPPVPSSSKALTHPRRPGYGTVGMKCVVRANHFLVEVANRDLFHYDVAITPEVTSRSVCRSIITQLVDIYKESHLGRLSPAYDGRKSLYTAAELPFTSKTFKIKLTERNRERDFDITIKLAGRADLHHLEQFLQGRHLDTPQETIQVLDIVLREFPSQNYVTVARSFFSKEFGHTRDIGDGLECWRGYYQSLRPTQMGLSLNIDISATSFYKPMAVLDFAAEYLRLRDITRPLTEKQCVGIKKALRGLRVEVIHRGDCCRRYKITGITNEPLSRLSFEDDKGKNVRVLDYFQDKYQYNLRHANWPCLQCGSDKRPTYLPMEVCKIVDGQRFSKKLNEQQVTEILRATCQRPQDRERSIIGMVRQNDYKNDKYAKEFGIQVRAELTSIEARVLPPPMLKYHETGREKICSPRVGAWNMINKKMVNGGNIQFWACISFSRNLHQDGVYNFCHSLFGTCNNIGMNVSANPIIDILFENFQNVERALRNAHSQADKALGGKPLQLLLIILPEISGSYGMIKRVCETELGIVSQCCLPKHAQQCKPQYMENVALKINVKVGGRNTVLADFVNNRVIPLVTDRPTIFFGADVTHPPPGEDSSSSIAAVVASMDWPQITNYKGLVSAQPHRQEMIKDLYTVTQDPQRGPVSSGMVRELLVSFYKKTNRKPDRIIFYRDGVSEGQFSHVLLYEMDAIRKACRSIQEGYLPPVTFVVVQKRHHTRLFPDVNSKQTDRSGNILPGTVVDRRICHPTEFDFYLCSHAGIQGTSRPTHYHVLYDENGFSADGLQILTNNLCYTYARCTRSVSVVPPAYYAHLVAFRARYYAEGDSEGESSVSGMRMRTAEVKPLPRIKDNVKEVMFYC